MHNAARRFILRGCAWVFVANIFFFGLWLLEGMYFVVVVGVYVHLTISSTGKENQNTILVNIENIEREYAYGKYESIKYEKNIYLSLEKSDFYVRVQKH